MHSHFWPHSAITPSGLHTQICDRSAKGRVRGPSPGQQSCRISWRMSSSSDNLPQFQSLHPNKNVFPLQRYPPFAYSLPAYPSGLLPQPNYSVATDQQQQPALWQQQGPQLTSIHSFEAELLSSTELARALAYCCGHCGKIKVTTSGVANGAKAFTRSHLSLCIALISSASVLVHTSSLTAA